MVIGPPEIRVLAVASSTVMPATRRSGSGGKVRFTGVADAATLFVSSALRLVPQRVGLDDQVIVPRRQAGAQRQVDQEVRRADIARRMPAGGQTPPAVASRMSPPSSVAFALSQIRSLHGGRGRPVARVPDGEIEADRLAEDGRRRRRLDVR